MEEQFDVQSMAVDLINAAEEVQVYWQEQPPGPRLVHGEETHEYTDNHPYTNMFQTPSTFTNTGSDRDCKVLLH